MSLPTDEPPAKRRRVHQKPEPRGPKLARLPKDAKVEKRPLMRPPIPSPYSGAHNEKVVYVGSKTPFMAAAKRVEKLLRLSEERLVQSATKLAQNDARRKSRRGGRQGDNDEILAIAEAVEAQKRNSTAGHESTGEEVVIKGSGKAIPKVMDLGVWFQQRDETYSVRLKTGTASSIDDVTYEKPVDETKASNEDAAMGNADDGLQEEGAKETVEETRIRNVSVLEVYVSLR
ncbi:hypothetical protein DOTSEDRAFT_75599 [Lecanosticta acicola]|uniref:Uncharacterized protein n=1 Tax=Lecanosticta acicola TaxID=111012 RepID=A0AAI8W1N2_9PEZI|nr:hypothetical protein DOTSEDRAFT_75599 [Lecanosticta acicola]